MTKCYALALDTTRKIMKKRYFCDELNPPYSLKQHFYCQYDKSKNMVEKTFHVLIDLSDELATKG